MDNYPNLNIEWLILGKGKMYKDRTATAAPASIPENDFGAGLLFPDPDEEREHEIIAETDLPEMEIPVQMLENQANIAATTGMNTTDNIVQTSVKQRKVSKIIVLFDDGSYQEM